VGEPGSACVTVLLSSGTVSESGFLVSPRRFFWSESVLLQFFNDLQRGNVTEATIVLIGYGLAIIIGISLHEFAHALVAYRLGDLTPVRDGRLTINPLAHFDIFGTVLILLVGFGYGKPVMVNPYNFRMDRRWGMALVAIAGPITNILIAIVFGLALRVLFGVWDSSPSEAVFYVINIFAIIVSLNLTLAVFNMIPFPPLDGSKVLLALLPGDLAYRVERFYLQTQQFGLIIVMLLFWFGGRFIGPIIQGPTNAMFNLIVGPFPF
jgi:Zn-dependent protease